MIVQGGTPGAYPASFSSLAQIQDLVRGDSIELSQTSSFHGDERPIG